MVASFSARSKKQSNWNVQQQQYIPLTQPHAGLLMNYSTALLQASLKDDASITFHPSQKFFGYYLRNHRHNLCGFPTGPDGTNCTYHLSFHPLFVVYYLYSYIHLCFFNFFFISIKTNLHQQK